MKRSAILLIDAFVSLAIGILLAVFPRSLMDLLGLPIPVTTFYPSLLGGVVIGIAIALIYEGSRPTAGRTGLGIVGAIAIDLCAALFLAGWLLCGKLNLPIRGAVVLWSIVALLIGVSLLGLFAERTQPHE
ncbi:hypothetical protein [Blastopirellula marina]|uniref:Uncharacterized protein n=1 Tax=Blastopirellula marina TaxID=124 RepID=A0A2S8FTV3_9BACT|nr:hypothetical protein [Blastopirellula marina]PQO35606.1 hypothetical protein C5Y98_13260 [Blastopirellula marina]PTL44246.1 hypothetical protein C5Y97_13270 [Blastopirellula marina]